MTDGPATINMQARRGAVIFEVMLSVALFVGAAAFALGARA